MNVVYSDKYISELDEEKLKDITQSYEVEELNVIIREIPDDYLWDELMRRESFVLKNINYIEEILDISFDNLRPIPAKAWKDIRTRYDEMQNKYKKIRKELQIDSRI